MTTKYDIGDTVLIPFVVVSIDIKDKERKTYRLTRTPNYNLQNCLLSEEEGIYGTCPEKPVAFQRLEEKKEIGEQL